MTQQVIEAEPRGFRAPGTGLMIAGGLIGAVGAYIFQAYGGRVLGEVDFAPVGLLWTTFFILATVLLVPLEQYVTREVARGKRAMPGDLRAAAILVTVGSVLGGGFVWLTLDDFFDSDFTYVIQIVLLMVGYGLLFFGKGVLAGRRRFRGVGWILIVESMVRLAAGVVLLRVSESPTMLGWAMVIGGFSVLGLAWWRHDKGESDHQPAPVGRFLGGYVGGTAASQLLLGGAPIAVALVGGSDAVVSMMFATFTLYRAPLTLIFALQGRILPYLVGLTEGESRAELTVIARRVAGVGLGLAAVGGAVGWLVGSDVVRLLYRDGFAPSRQVAMLAAFGVMVAATAQVLSQVVVAEGRTGRLARAWAGGLVVALFLLFLVGGAPDDRVSLAFAGGELTAFALMSYVAVRR